MQIDILNLMNKYSEFSKNFCRKSRITPYQFYILSVIRGGASSFLDLVARFSGRDTITVLGETHKTTETALRNFCNAKIKRPLGCV